MCVGDGHITTNTEHSYPLKLIHNYQRYKDSNNFQMQQQTNYSIVYSDIQLKVDNVQRMDNEQNKPRNTF